MPASQSTAPPASPPAPANVVTPPTPAVIAPPIAPPTSQSRSTSGTMTRAPPERRASASSTSSSTTQACEACLVDRAYVDRIRSPSHVLLAIRLLFTDPTRRRDLFTNWIHVPLGITSLLFLTWLIKQAMDRAPFRFPSPVLAMLLLFVLLLLLDYLSTTQTVSKWQQRKGRQGKVLLQPMLALLEAPCDFCLRYMSVMFTPSFILIPAREIISGREIGLITGWFAVSQVAGLIFPVLLHRAIRWVVGASRKRFSQRKGRKEEKVRRAEEQRRASVATLVAVMSNITVPPTSAAQTSTGADEKIGAKLGSIATGLSGMTAIATAPLQLNVSRTPLRIELSSDAQRHLDHVALETARQQGDPHATPAHREQHYPSTPTSPRPASAHRCNSGYFPRGRHLAQQERPGRSSTVSPRRRPRSGNDANKGRIGAVVVGPASGLRSEMRRPQSANDTRQWVARSPVQKDTATPTFDEYIFQARQDLMARRASATTEGVDPRSTIQESGEATLVMPTRAPPTPARGSIEVGGGRPSKSDSDTTIGDAIQPHPTTSSDDSKETTKMADQQLTTTDSIPPASPAEEDATPETDAVDRLVNRLWTSLPWLVTLVTLIAGLPIFYLLSISLPLFLAVNILTFLVAITLVPPFIRRYAHPILTTSLLTVFLLWGLGAARGWTLRQTLASYSVDAKYTVLWSPSGYAGPVVGAGDVLFSTLDAGIVSLAIPMYRYRRDLWNHLSDMLVVLLPCAMLSVFVWPTIAAAMGIAPQRALAFASRFMSTPLAIELSLTIGADESITVVLVVITGILISIFKDPFFRLFRLNPENDGDEHGDRDYLTIGIAMGSTAGAIGASSLISKPRCMAIASLSFVLFGAILLVLAAIPPVVDTMRGLAGAALEFVPAV